MTIIVNSEMYDVNAVNVSDLAPEIVQSGEMDVDLHLQTSDGKIVIVRTKKVEYENLIQTQPDGPWVINGRVRKLLHD